MTECLLIGVFEFVLVLNIILKMSQLADTWNWLFVLWPIPAIFVVIYFILKRP